MSVALDTCPVEIELCGADGVCVYVFCNKEESNGVKTQPMVFNN